MRILAPVVAIALLIGALVGISVSAAETTPAIVSMNVEYGSELYLYYAVDKSTVAGTPKLEVVNADGTQVLSTVTAYNEKTVNGKPCYIFKTAGVAPGKINEVEYVRAADNNGTGDVVSYSIEQYFYDRLYKQGYAAMTEDKGTDYARRNLYFSFLKYGQSAQNLFYADSEDKIGDSIYVAVKGNSALTGAYEYADGISLAEPAVDGFDYWKVTELSPFGEIIFERKLAAGYEYVVLTNALIVPVTDDENAEDVEVYDPALITFNTEPVNITEYAGKVENVLFERQYDDATGNWYLSVDKYGTNGTASFYILPTGGDAATATKAEIKLDLYVPEGAVTELQNNIVIKSVYGKSGTFKSAPFLHYSSKADSAKYFKHGDWNTVKVVYEPTKFIDVDGEDAYIAYAYVNNMDTPVYTYSTNYSIGKDNANIPKMTEIGAYVIAFNAASKASFKIDNVSFVFK